MFWPIRRSILYFASLTLVIRRPLIGLSFEGKRALLAPGDTGADGPTSKARGGPRVAKTQRGAEHGPGRAEVLGNISSRVTFLPGPLDWRRGPRQNRGGGGLLRGISGAKGRVGSMQAGSGRYGLPGIDWCGFVRMACSEGPKTVLMLALSVICRGSATPRNRTLGAVHGGAHRDRPRRTRGPARPSRVSSQAEGFIATPSATMPVFGRLGVPWNGTRSRAQLGFYRGLVNNPGPPTELIAAFPDPTWSSARKARPQRGVGGRFCARDPGWAVLCYFARKAYLVSLYASAHARGQE